MTAFTRLGSSLWDWEPWTELPFAARILWLALYTSAEAKRHVPGLWQGGIPAMADAARMPPDEVIAALDRLLERDLVEYDAKNRVLRLCELPDAGEYPSNGKVIRSWWTRFQSVPECQVRDAHVRTIAWILSEGGRRSHKGVSQHHVEAWGETFGLITVPAPRRRGIRRLADSDTGTLLQPSLFPVHAASVPSGSGIAPQESSSYPQGSAPPVDNSAALQQMNKIRAPETVSDTVSDTNRIPDPGSRIPDRSSLSGEGGSGGGHELGKRATLTLVPLYTVADVLRELAQGPYDAMFDGTHADALVALLPRWVAQGVTLEDFRVLAQYNRVFEAKTNARLIASVADMKNHVHRASRSLEERQDRLNLLSEWRGRS